MSSNFKPVAYDGYDHDAFARSKARDDFWGQVHRTVNGDAVSEDQITWIRDAIITGLQMHQDDNILDLACGNGALSARLFNHCRTLTVVDLSEFLISVAQEHFANPPHYTFIQNDMVDYLKNCPDYLQFNKVLCYGSFSYLSENAAVDALSILHNQYSNVHRIYIGNLPDLEKRHLFFTKSTPPYADLKKHTTAIGIWRTQDEFCALAKKCGWVPTICHMDDDFYASKYRYDVILERQ